MPIDVNRYGYLIKEYRYVSETDPTIENTYAKARELEIPSNLDVSTIETLIADMFGVIGSPRRRFQVDLKGTDHFDLNSFAGSLPARYFTAPEFGVEDMPCIVTAIKINEAENITEVELWG